MILVKAHVLTGPDGGVVCHASAEDGSAVNALAIALRGEVRPSRASVLLLPCCENTEFIRASI